MSEVAITNVILSLFVLLGVSVIFGEIFERIKLDAVVGYLIAGLVLGPSLLNWISPHAIEDFAIIGAILILFLAGLKEQDASSLYKNKKAMFLGIGVLVITFLVIFAFLMSPLMPWLSGKEYTFLQVLFIALAFAVVDLGVPAKILLSKKLLNTEFGQTVLNGAVINVIAGLTMLTVLTLFFSPEFSTIAYKLLGVLAFIGLFLVLFFLVSRLGRYMVLLESEEVQFTLTFVLILVLAFLTETLGFSNILGAFLAGIVISRAHFATSKSFMDKFKAVSMGLFIPLFFAWFGLELQLWGEMGIIANFGVALIFLALSLIPKFVVTYFICKANKIKAPALVGSTMLSLDVETLIILLLAVEIGVFPNNEILSIFAPTVLITTILVSVLVIVFMKVEKKDLEKSR
ncbi:cation:proton antiporter [archaeon]|jgi:Kef-type K+ transport system membrane component KefB|nr:cation:proton antiporter [archaeon]MBT4397717.1 cation:proton antiporter [archaeon]MBT4441587.1 cation:proton antiporter [archaeon]